MTAPELRFEDPAFGVMPLREGRRNVVGRADGDIVIRHEKISKQHAKLWRDGDDWWIVDAGSTNGVFVSGARAAEPVRLAHGMRVAFGPVEAVFFDPSGAAQAAAPSAAAAWPDARRAQPKRVATGTAATRTRFRKSSSPLARIAWGAVIIVALLLGVLFAIERNTRAPLSTQQSTQQAAKRAANEFNESTTSSSSAAQPRPPVAIPVAPVAPSDDATPGADEAGEATAATPTDTDESIAGETSVQPPQGASSGEADDNGNLQPRAPEKPAARKPVAQRPTPQAGGAAADPTAAAKGADGDPAAVPDPVAQALQARDVDALIALFLANPKRPRAAQIQSLLTSGPIVVLRRSGYLPAAAESVLTAALDECFPLRMSAVDPKQLEKLGFPLDLRDRVLHVRHEHDYSVGLGRAFGNERVAPHPKRVTVRMSKPKAQQGNPGALEKLFDLEAQTPVGLANGLSGEGLTEDEIWRATLEPLRERLTRQLRKALH